MWIKLTRWLTYCGTWYPHVVGLLLGTGGARRARERISPEEYEHVFGRLWSHAQHQPYAIKTTEAPHYRRFVLEVLRQKDKAHPDGDRTQPMAKRLTMDWGWQGNYVCQPHW